MKFDAVDQRAMLEAVGDLAEITGTDDSLYVKFIGAAQDLDYSGDAVVSVPPVVKAAAADVAELGITGDQDSGTMLTVKGDDWRVMSVEPAESGFVTMQLGDI